MSVSKIQTIIDKACNRKQINKDILESMITFVFSETKSQFSKFEELSVYLPGLFIFFYGRKRLILLKVELEAYINKVKVEGHPFIQKTWIQKLSVEEMELVLKKIDALIERYEVYINEKRETKKAYKESKNKPKEHEGLSSGEFQEV